ncbi:uncharacterized protein DSM5745_05655 [Aspergillus mulundensis]|uniref:Uncharacterized protein n=1 Tax=Aspergillus mulundensis TaxID=1810919 RepID=A0A3D8RXM3_9EURO|nr:hypothetical protein DSM5745_05655 [Aspergillus mulundensis]RDW78803.1 hypothetical protein DSM5745_05655 [Aspergillus mulundensis]
MSATPGKHQGAGTPQQDSQRDKKLATLRASITDLEAQTAQLEIQIAEIRTKLK